MPHSTPGVVPLVQNTQTLAGDMRVDLGRRDIGMAKQHLNHTQVGTMLEKMRGKGMA